MELKDILEKLDLPADIAEAENKEEAFTKAFTAKFVSKEQAINDKDIVRKISGKVLGATETKLKQLGGFTHSELEGKKLEDVIDMIGEKYSTEITTLKETATKGNDEKLTALTEETEKYKKLATKYKSDHETLSSTYQKEQENWKGELKNYKIQTLLNSERAKVQFVDKIKDIEREGYDSRIGKKYKFDLDENEKLVVYNDKGEPIQNPKKVGSYYAPYEVLTMEAAENGILKQNNASTTQEKKSYTFTSTAGGEQKDNGRKISPAAQQHAEVQKGI